MNRNSKHTALEILLMIDTSFELGDVAVPAEDVFGKYRVQIGGISGISNPNHLIRVQASAKSLDVVVGNTRHEVKLGQAVKQTKISDNARVALDERAEEIKARNEKLAELKAETEE
jgi:hypothetical protein